MIKLRSKLYFLSLIFILFLILQSAVFAADKPVRKEVLDNGLTVLIKEDPEKIVAIEVFVKVGVMSEEKEKCGLSRFVQALLLRGTNSRSAKDITMEIESVGGVIQGNSNSDYCEYFVQSTSDYFDTGLNLIGDVIQHPAFLSEEIEKERENLFLEIDKLETKPFLKLYDMFNAQRYQRHPYGRPTNGYRETIEHITREDIIKFYKENYVTRNIVISIAGNVDSTYVLNRIKEVFRDIPDTPPLTINNPNEPKPLKWREDFRKTETDTGWFLLGYPAPSISSPDYPPMEVLQLIIGGSMNSRMWIKLREKKGLAYDLGSFMSPLMGPGHLVTYIATDPGKVNEVKKVILDEIRDIKKGNVYDEEISNMKNFLTGQYYINEETVKSKAYNLGLYETLGVGYEYYISYPSLIEKVTKEDIIRVANEYLENPISAILSPVNPNSINIQGGN